MLRKMVLINFISISLLSLMISSNTYAAENAYLQTNLVANNASYNPTFGVDENLLNPWGIALRPAGSGGHFWISNTGAGNTTTYIGDANGVPLFQDGLKVVPIEASLKAPDGLAQVTGQVYNAASDIIGQPTEFFVSGPAVNYATDPATPVGNISGSAKFVFVTMEGTINAWRSGTNPGMVEAAIIKDYSTVTPASLGLRNTPGYTGVAITTDAFTLDSNGNKVADNRIYAADFANNRVQVFNNQWDDISNTVNFERPADLSEAYFPFNIQYLNDRLYVAYAENSYEIDEPTEEIPGPSFGRIVSYDRDGNILQDYTNHDLLNAPWGLAIAPEGFGAFSNALLVGNFGDGTIAAYDRVTGESLGYLKDPDGNVISIDGLWGLAFGNGVLLGDAKSLYFTAGPDEERDGVFGKLTVAAPVPEPETYAMMLAGLGFIAGAARRRR